MEILLVGRNSSNAPSCSHCLKEEMARSKTACSWTVTNGWRLGKVMIKKLVTRLHHQANLTYPSRPGASLTLSIKSPYIHSLPSCTNTVFIMLPLPDFKFS